MEVFIMAIYFGKPNTEAVGEDITGDKVNLDLEPNPVIIDIDAYAIEVNGDLLRTILRNRGGFAITH
ncbi:hypothetical protein [Methanothrix sp.]|uniref:hypothetical protein n=1 Tax=Methanothrix sp. TaxID=90426 RepID=UPI00345EACB5